MNKRGQALVEFVIILPILLLLIFAFIDLGRIIVCKNHLEGVMSEVANLEDEEFRNRQSELINKLFRLLNGEKEVVISGTKI